MEYLVYALGIGVWKILIVVLLWEGSQEDKEAAFEFPVEKWPWSFNNTFKREKGENVSECKIDDKRNISSVWKVFLS